MILGHSILELSCSKTDRQLDRQTDRHEYVLYSCDEDTPTLKIIRNLFSTKIFNIKYQIQYRRPVETGRQ